MSCSWLNWEQKLEWFPLLIPMLKSHHQHPLSSVRSLYLMRHARQLAASEASTYTYCLHLLLTYIALSSSTLFPPLIFFICFHLFSLLLPAPLHAKQIQPIFVNRTVGTFWAGTGAVNTTDREDKETDRKTESHPIKQAHEWWTGPALTTDD